VTAAITRRPVLILPGDAPQDVWLAERRNGIGASDVAAIIGVSPYQGPLHVWLDKLGHLPPVDNPAMKWGRRFEDDVLEEFVTGHPELVVTPKPGSFAVPGELWRRFSPDAIAEDDEGPQYVEIKTGMSYGDAEQWGEPGTDQIPLPYLCQVTWGCDVYGCARWRLAVLLLDQRDYREYEGRFDSELAAELRTRAGAFWHVNVLGGIEPDADGLGDTLDLLTKRYSATDRDAEVDLPAEALMWAESYRVNHEALAEREAAKQEAGNLLRQRLAAAGAAVGKVGDLPVVTWRRPKPKTVTTFDEEAFAKAHPGLYAEFTTSQIVQSAPTLRVKGVSW